MFKDAQNYAVMQGDDLITGMVQDCTPYAEDARARHNEGMHGSKELKHAARIPFVIIEKYMHDNGVSMHECFSNPAHFRRMCQDPANADFRIWKGAL